MIRLPLLLIPSALVLLLATVIWLIMTPGAGELSIRFTGPLSPWMALGIGVVACFLMEKLYRRESDPMAARILKWAGACRISAVFLVLLMLCGPVLDHEHREGIPGRVILYVDRSGSMETGDEEMSMGRKLLWAKRYGWLDERSFDSTLGLASGHVAEAARLAELTMAAYREGRPIESLLTRLADEGKRAVAELGRAPDMEPIRQDASLAPTGSARRELWSDVSGDSVADLRRSSRFPDSPSEVGSIGRLESPRDIGDQYGQRISGLLFPPATGEYVFYLASDDGSEFRLSDNERPEGLRTVAEQSGWVEYLEWRTRSSPVSLEAGQAYAFELLHKEGSGSDFVALGWRLPDGTQERPIPGSRLAPPAAEFDPVVIWPGKRAVIDELRRKLIEPAELLAAGRVAGEPRLTMFRRLRDDARRLDRMLEEAFDRQGEMLVHSDSRMREVAERFDRMSRWDRMEQMLLGDGGALSSLRLHYDIEVRPFADVVDAPLVRLERLDVARPVPEAFDAVEWGHATSLTAPMQQALAQRPRQAGVRQTGDESASPDQTGSVHAVILTDGQHNLSRTGVPTPEVVAQQLGRAGIELLTVGVGSGRPPRAVSLIGTDDVPSEIFKENRLSGAIRVFESVNEQQPYRLTVEHEGNVLFEESLVARRIDDDTPAEQRVRKVPFAISIEEIVSELERREARGNVRMLSMPLKLTARISGLEDEANSGGHEMEILTRAVSHRRRILVVDGRPRWSFRYMKNIFDRDPQWEVSQVLPRHRDGRASFERGDGLDQFPNSEEELFRYDLVVFGEVPISLLREEELDWLRKFVEARGGGWVWVDGQRGLLRDYIGTPLEPLLPVRWKGDGVWREQWTWRLTESGAQWPVASLDEEPDRRRSIWRQLPTPRWAASVEARPGSEVHVELQEQDQRWPVMVTRPVGAGKTFFLGTDETFRWRYELAERYQHPFWSALASWSMESPFHARDGLAAVAVDKLSYEPGEPIRVRARLFSEQGDPILEGEASAWFYRDGEPAGRVEMVPDEGGGGLWTGQTSMGDPPLESGTYELGVGPTDLGAPASQARTIFQILPGPMVAGERAITYLDEMYLRRLAESAMGEYVREEQLPGWVERLRQQDNFRVIRDELVLWRSYAWFIPIIGLLTLEWLLRKRAGLL
ncbi:MAG: hypothetical protein JJU36_15650 [Phycisphaeraceae bacterium]|nr:hypothetical protein [Phycisphaeraceae bacterium]